MTGGAGRQACTAGRPAPVAGEFDAWVERLRSTHRALSFTCAHRLSDPAFAEPVAVRVVAELLARPTVFRYFGLPFSGRIARYAEALLADTEDGRPPDAPRWAELEERVRSIPDHHRDVLVAVCIRGDDVATLAGTLGCTVREAVDRRAAMLGYMRATVAGLPVAGPDREE